MDPNATLLNMLDVLSEPGANEDMDCRAYVMECCNDLVRWIAGGGFLPTDPRPFESR